MENNIAGNITVFTHSSIRISAGKEKLYFDPFEMAIEPHDADYIFLTHDHYDHFSPEDIAKIVKETTVFIAPEPMEDKVKEILPEGCRLVTVEPDSICEVDGHHYETIPAYNVGKAFHPKEAKWCGYVVDIDGIRVYVAGDTDMNEDNCKVKCDIALLPAGGKYTCDPQEAAEFANTIKPSVAIPTHYGTIAGSPDCGDIFMQYVKEPIRVELKLG